MNPLELVKLKNSWGQLKKRHPKLSDFFRSVVQKTSTGTIVKIKVTTAQGEEFYASFKVTAADMELFQQLKEKGKKHFQ